MHIDPGRLLLLTQLRDHGSVTKVAQRTHRTPPAVSQQLARLEQEVGAQLVERRPHGCSLTPLGMRLVAHADQVNTAVQRALEDAANYLDAHRDRLRLGAFPTAGLALLPEALAALRHRHPHAELSVVDLGPVEGTTLVAEHTLDLALVGEYAEPIEAPPGTRLVPLIDDPIHVVMPEDHPLTRRPVPKLQDFAADAWACAPAALPNRRQLDRAATADGFTPRVPFESDSYAVAQAVVSAGVAVSFVPRLALRKPPGTTHRPLADPHLSRRIHAVVPSNTDHAPLAETFLQLLHNICADLTSSPS